MIKIIGLKCYYTNQQVLNGIDLEITENTIQAILGVNGAGKSTLIHCIAHIIKYDAGEVYIDGEKITFYSYEYRRKVGYVFEKPIYIEKLSAKEYLSFVAELYDIKGEAKQIRINELLDFFDLPKDNKKYIESYSKGMKSKVSLAAAMLHEPKYFILDEPFDGLDFVSVQKITRKFKELASKGATFLITSHQYDIIAELCDKFALLKDGKILFNLTMQELKEEAQKQDKSVKEYLEKMMI